VLDPTYRPPHDPVGDPCAAVTATVDPPLLDLPAEADGPTPEPGCPDRHRRTLVLGLVLLPLWALVCTGVLETPMWWSEVNHGVALFAALSKPLDVLLVLLVLLLLWCLTGRLWLSMGLLLGVTAGLSAVNVAKMSILAEPLYPSDYQFLHDTRFLLDMVKPVSVVEAVVGLVVLTAATIAASRVMGRHYPRLRRAQHPRGWAALVGTRVVGTLVLALVLSSALHFNDPGNPWRRFYEARGATWQPFSQAKNYRTNGFVGGALYNMPSDPMPVPDGYRAATMQAIAQKYTDRAQARNAGRTAGALDGVNVVLVLSEAFGDLSRLKDVSVDHDTMPLTRQTIADSWGGSTLANFFGTGTSSMEFEALTGQSLGLFNPQVVSPYQNFMTGLSSYPSAVGWFTDHGHVPIAVHPFHEEFYRRDTVYPMLGFKQFIYDRTMSEKTKLEHGKYISDQSSFDEVEKQLRSHDKPLLVNLVTMQNHVPTADFYDDPVPVRAPGRRDLVDAMGDYARGQELSDQALHRFLGDLRDSDEPTVVVFYGDHYPATFTHEVLDANPGLAQLETPMFIWSSQGQSARALPVTSPADFLPYVFDLVGEPLPPYYELLSEVAEQIGAIGPGRIVAPDGTQETEADLTAEQRQLLNDYRLVQYDFSIGQRYAVDDMFYDFGSQP
jgi:phosphoglycerol transferase MdoB-like AlkP superfamily enzyme